MYTKEEITENADVGEMGEWMILDHDGDCIATVRTEHEADVLLSHLNR